MTTYDFDIPRIGGGAPLRVSLATGQSIIILGANGSGKTRLGAELERQLSGKPVLRVTAQKSLVVNDALNLISVERAKKRHEWGHEEGNEGSKVGNRFGGKPATHPLNDFDALLQRLFAEHASVASEHLDAHLSNAAARPPTTKLHELKKIWDGLLPHRLLKIVAPISIQVLPKVNPAPRAAQAEAAAVPPAPAEGYPGSEMSDGERAIFYFLGQCLVARAQSALIIDEPEGHVHKAVLGPLWNAIEKARPDCAFVYITHDLDFAASRTVSKTYFTRAYTHGPMSWDIEELPEAGGLPEHVVAEVAGSRMPILFVEGERGKLDVTIYSDLYADFTVIPVGSCTTVMRAVASYNGTAPLHRYKVRGLVDADDRSTADIDALREQHVYALPVVEVENLLLLPKVFRALATALAADAELDLAKLEEQVMKLATKDIEAATLRYTSRQLDRRLKRIASDAADLATLDANYKKETSAIDLTKVADEYQKLLKECIRTKDLPALLRLYDNKGMVAAAAKILGLDGRRAFLEKVGRLLGGREAANKALRKELADALPTVS